MQEQFEDLQKRAGHENVWPVVDCRWGYAAFVIRIKNSFEPNEWWVAEMFDQHNSGKVTDIKRICQY